MKSVDEVKTLIDSIVDEEREVPEAVYLAAFSNNIEDNVYLRWASPSLAHAIAAIGALVNELSKEYGTDYEAILEVTGAYIDELREESEGREVSV